MSWPSDDDWADEELLFTCSECGGRFPLDFEGNIAGVCDECCLQPGGDDE